MSRINFLCKFLFVLLFSYGNANAVNGIFNQNSQPIGLNNNYPQTSVLRDPFTPSKLMYELIGSQRGLENGAYGFVPNIYGAKIPKMKLRGFIDNNDEKPLALIEILGSGTFIVREGDEINIDPSNPRQAIRISKISRGSITVETGTLGSIRILR